MSRFILVVCAIPDKIPLERAGVRGLHSIQRGAGSDAETVINTYDALSLRIADAGAPLAGNYISDCGAGRGSIIGGLFRNQSFSEAKVNRHTSRGWRWRCLMTLDEALTLINNLDMREPLRRYGPKW
jgi:hypothetical protein